MQTEINGDERLTVTQRLNYLIFNFARNLKPGTHSLRWRRYCLPRLTRTPRQASPGRALMERFILEQLPLMLTKRNIRVLEFGCGSGSLTKLLTEAGYSGTYIGIDVQDRFDRAEESDFSRTFVSTDANKFDSNETFDLVISVSALEHIPTDNHLIERFEKFLSPSGIQLHFVPTGWGLPIYLWHGYRQYSRASLYRRFGSKHATFFAMGGAVSFLLHFFFITLGEILFNFSLRKKLPALYGTLLDQSLRLDRFIPFCSTMCAVCLSASAVYESE